MCNVVIIGGMAAGCKAAARLSRLSQDYNIIIVEQGSFLSFGNCGLPLHASGDIDDLLDLSKTSYGVVRDEKYFKDVKNIKVLLRTKATEVDNEKRQVVCYSIDKDEMFTLSYDKLIVASGSEPKRPVFKYPESDLISSFHSPIDSKKFRQIVQQNKIKKAAIIGGGFIGCEMIEALTTLWGIETVLVEKEKSLLPGCLDTEMGYYLKSCLEQGNIKLKLAASISRIEIDKNGAPVILLDDEEITTDYVFYCLGVKPESKLIFKPNIKTGEYGGIVVDEQMKTSIEGIWAAGDCVELKNLVTGNHGYFSSGSLANRMGRAAADSIAKRQVSFEGTAGTFSLKLFDNIICGTGLIQERAERLGINTGSVIGCWSDRPDYYPGAKNIFGKMVYEKSGLRLLGLQLIGEGEVTRYIDVFSELLSRQGTVADLINVEHAYTPAHSSPVSPLNNLGYMAYNQETDVIKNVSPLIFPEFDGIIIDVREQSETNPYPVSEKYYLVPLSELRFKINEWNIEQQIMFVCEKGPRAYEAARIFVKHGYKNVCYLGGGNLFYSRIKNCCTENVSLNTGKLL